MSSSAKAVRSGRPSPASTCSSSKAIPEDGSLSVIERAPAAEPASDTEDWFARGLALEAQDANRAMAAYERAIDADASCLDAYVNLGRLLHDAKRLARAETVYREALLPCGNDAVLLYNLAVLLDDMGRGREAIDGIPGGASRRSRARRLPLQPGAALRAAREAEGRDPAHGALSPPDRAPPEIGAVTSRGTRPAA